MCSYSKLLQTTALILFMVGQVNSACHDWVECDLNSGVCPTGTEQSPIDYPANITGSDAICVKNPIILNLNSEVIEANVEDHDIVVPGQSSNMIWHSEDVIYNFDLANVHFHTGSEHRFGGKQYDIEMHMVHLDESAQERGLKRPYAVAAFVYEIDGENRDKFLDYVMGIEEASRELFENYVPIDVLHYLGGLTTPTCDEVVNWFSFVEPIKISQAQYDEFVGDEELHDIIGIPRDVQDINDREIIKYQYKCLPADNTVTQCYSINELASNDWCDVNCFVNEVEIHPACYPSEDVEAVQFCQCVTTE